MPRTFSYTHTQSSASATWTIVHNLGTNAPVVDAFVDFNGQKTKILPKEVEIVDSTTIKVIFSTPKTGSAAVR